MKTIIQQLNSVKYSKDDFLNYKSANIFEITDQLKKSIETIKSNIKKNNNIHKKNSFNNHSNYSNHSNHYKNNNKNKGNFKPEKSWRLNKTKIIKEDITKLEKCQNEINALLNKLSPKNFDSIIGRIVDYYNNLDTQNRLINKTIDNVFLKAVMQPIYCPYYVKFLKILDDKYKTDNIIDKKCQDYKDIITPIDVTENKEKSSLSEQEKYDLFCKANKAKTFKAGYSQFIGELFNNEMITKETLETNLSFFVENLEEHSKTDAKSNYVEDLLICICKLFVTVYKENTDTLIKNYCSRLISIQNNKDLPKRLQFKIMDVRDVISV